LFQVNVGNGQIGRNIVDHGRQVEAEAPRQRRSKLLCLQLEDDVHGVLRQAVGWHPSSPGVSICRLPAATKSRAAGHHPRICRTAGSVRRNSADVNIATYLLLSAIDGESDVAAVIANDPAMAPAPAIPYSRLPRTESVCLDMAASMVISISGIASLLLQAPVRFLQLTLPLQALGHGDGLQVLPVQGLLRGVGEACPLGRGDAEYNRFMTGNRHQLDPSTRPFCLGEGTC
jgi:hypothetical protein